MDGRITVRLRRDELPGDAALVVRGGVQTLSDDHIRHHAGVSLRQYGFFAVSVFVAADGDVQRLVSEVEVLRNRPKLRLARCGDVRRAGFPLLATGGAHHFSVILSECTPELFGRLRACFGDPVPNPGFQP